MNDSQSIYLHIYIHVNDIKNLTLSLAIEIVELAKINQLNFSGKRLGKSGIGNESIIAFFSCWRRTFQNAAIFSFNLIYYLNHSLFLQVIYLRICSIN